ncbi:VanZ like protein [Saccharothrix saharensis]|uniref:VanZ like protein n=1 Tax=Saccharothrix saharensis TaxID=571190 RepID=A0A543JFC3_9PSEU|nr:VanZ family protein [Saccharothrix saharensis]TQM81494.1 VanZ like protein [Saccharothrix saharensis]
MSAVGQDAYIAELVLNQPETVAALFSGAVLLGAVGFVLARYRGWAALPAVLAGFGLALAVAATLARPGGTFTVVTTDPIGMCVGNEFSLTGSLQRLNLVMLVPFAFFATLATRRPWAVLGVSAAFSASVEFVQALTAIGVCEAQDFLNNTAGAFFAVLVGWLVTAAAGSPRTTRAGRPSRGPAATG